MTLTSTYVVHHVLVPAAVIFFLIWGLIGVAVGVGLIVSSARMFRLFKVMNHYVSTRHALKPLAMPHDVGQSVRSHRRLIGTFFILGAAYCIYAMLAWFDSRLIAAALHLSYPKAFVAWILESLRWSFIVFSAFAVVIGVMLMHFPDALGRFEAYANRWVSVRKLTIGADTMVLTLDKLVEAFPRAAGSIIVLAALYVAANAAFLWLRFH